MNNQKYSSAMTSININKLPAIYNKINWNKFQGDTNCLFPILLDYGCGKYTDHIEHFLMDNYCILYMGYDPNWGRFQTHSTESLKRFKPDVIICSNVLNVIYEDSVVESIHKIIQSFDVPYFISVYEGNKTEKGGESKKDCWQRNQSTRNYLMKGEVVKNRIITRSEWVKYIK